MVVPYTTINALVAITTDVVSSNLDQGEVYNVIRYSLSGRWFSPGPPVSSTIKMTATIYLKYC